MEDSVAASERSACLQKNSSHCISSQQKELLTEYKEMLVQQRLCSLIQLNAQRYVCRKGCRKTEAWPSSLLATSTLQYERTL